MRTINKSLSLAILLILGLISYSVYCERINLRPYLIDPPKSDADKLFMQFVSDFNKQYTSSTEYNFRREIFKRNLQIFNSQKKPTSDSYTIGPNFFADQTPAEISSRFNTPQDRLFNQTAMNRVIRYMKMQLDQHQRIGETSSVFLQLLQAILENPVLAEVNADLEFVFYNSGILDSDVCNAPISIKIVGYGTDADTKVTYYIVKNSWGESWGEKGYARIASKPGVGVCGIHSRPSFYIVNSQSVQESNPSSQIDYSL